MLKAQTKRNQSLLKTNFNKLDKYILNRSSLHKINTIHHANHSLRKHINRSTDYTLGDISKIKKLLPIHQKSERIDVQQTDLFLERQPLQYFNNQQPQKHKKLKSNKTLLCLLLNHFHQGHNKNKTCTHSDTSSRHNLTSHTVILHKSTTNIHYSRNHTKQGVKMPLKGSISFASFHSKNVQMIIDVQDNKKGRKNGLKNNFREVNMSREKKRRDDVTHNTINRYNLNHQSKLNPHKSDFALQKTRLNGVKATKKQNKPQRSIQKCYKLSPRQEKDFNDEQTGLNPWSTTLINEQSSGL